MLRLTLLFAVFSFAAVNPADEPLPPTKAPLSTNEHPEPWLQLFDGETTFGWTIDGHAKVENGLLILGGTKESSATFTGQFGYGNLMFDAFTDDAKDARLTFNSYQKGAFIHAAHPAEKGRHRFRAQVTHGDLSIWADGSKGFGIRGKFDDHTTIAFHVPAGQRMLLQSIYFRPRYLKPIFNGKDLTGWKEHAERKSKFTINERGELNVKDGPGDLQTEEQWDDFILQLDCISNGKHLNSGIFFRCLPGQYQQGYEAQIRNQWEGDDRTKPVDFGTGAIYRRQPARKVVSSDGEWFTMTVLARGNRLMTWANGYPVVDFLDTRPPHENARNGTKLGKGAISIQGHDPTTDLSFRNIRIAGLTRANP